ncbi:MAG: M20/M25/M40 family metallo-hydrolase [Acidimicrobiales bacterium]|jgi:acetylornithine deacetylase/succinyl-diaminopimelate desuccinylase-like protein
MPTGFRPQDAVDHARDRWRTDVLPLLEQFARIPNQSPAYDAGWEAAGYMGEAADLVAAWADRRDVPGATVEVVRLPGLTPTVLVEVPATDPEATGTVLVYGHYDKQPPFDGWSQGRGPWAPVVEGDWLYARGVADDGYALPSALLAVESVRAAGGRHGRLLILAEGSEESGSPHLPAVLAHLSGRIGVPDVVIALDSGSPTYDRMWVTTSLRGALVGTLTVEVLEHGVHSGSAGGAVPSSFRIARHLLDRIEDASTGDLVLPELRCDPPDWAEAASRGLAAALAEAGQGGSPYPVVEGVELQGADVADRAMRTWWRGSLAVVGADGLPPTRDAGAVLLPFTTLKLVLRLPPTCDPEVAADAVARALVAAPPYGARVEWNAEPAAGGWAAVPLAPWLAEALDRASRACFGRPSARCGEGGTIPFMGWLAARFPDAQILAAGVLGPGSNAHGPDEGLHLPTAERLTGALALLFDAHAAHGAGAGTDG